MAIIPFFLAEISTRKILKQNKKRVIFGKVQILFRTIAQESQITSDKKKTENKRIPNFFNSLTHSLHLIDSNQLIDSEKASFTLNQFRLIHRVNYSYDNQMPIQTTFIKKMGLRSIF